MTDFTPTDHTLPNGALMGQHAPYPRYKGITQRTIADVRWKVIRDLMPLQELADLLGIHCETAGKRLESGAIPLTTKRIDRFTFVPVAAALDYLDTLGIDLVDEDEAA